MRRAREGSNPDEIEMRPPRPNEQGQPGIFDGTFGSDAVVTTPQPSTCREYSMSAIMVKSELSVDVERAV